MDDGVGDVVHEGSVFVLVCGNEALVEVADVVVINLGEADEDRYRIKTRRHTMISL